MSVIVFPGQGSQFVGMSRDFYDNFDSAKHIFSLIQDTTKINIKDIIQFYKYLIIVSCIGSTYYLYFQLNQDL